MTRRGLLGLFASALAAKAITYHTKIKYRFVSVDEQGTRYSKIYDTTPGRAVLGQDVLVDAGPDFATKPTLQGRLVTLRPFRPGDEPHRDGPHRVEGVELQRPGHAVGDQPDHRLDRQVDVPGDDDDGFTHGGHRDARGARRSRA